MTDSATRAAEPAHAEVLRYRAGEPTRGPLLWEAGLWETPAEALEALRSGAWVPVRCGFKKCFGGEVQHPDDDTRWDPCPVCMGTGKEWSPRHAELAAYAGEESLRQPGVYESDWIGSAWYREADRGRTRGGVDDSRPLLTHLRESRAFPGFGPVPPVVAAYGVVREWVAVMKGGISGAVEDALDAVERWIREPSEANRLACRDPWTFAINNSPHSLLAGRVYWPELNYDSITRAVEDGLPEDQAAQAARAWVRRWALAPLVGHGR